MTDIQHIKSEILAKTDLPALVSTRVDLQRKGSRRAGCCPFHEERSPSFYVFDDHYHCFGCSAHGDAISWVQHFEGIGFIDALKWLGERAKVDVSGLSRDRRSSQALRRLGRVQQLKNIAQDFFVAQLQKASDGKAREYLSSRGLSQETIDHFGLGFAPGNATALTSLLLRQGFTRGEIEESSLATSYDGRLVDFFRDRAMIPIRDTQDRIIAFGGRALNDHPQKYKNSRYDKSETLFGLNHARTEIRRKLRALVVEGYLDAISLWQHGFPEAVACQGTALTASHIRQLGAATASVYLLFDGDQAGTRAAIKTLTVALNAPDMRFRVVRLPKDEDPDSFVRNHGAEDLESCIAQSIDLVSFAIDSKLVDGMGAHVPELINKDIIPWLRSVEDPIQQNYLAHKVAQKAGLSPDIILAKIRHKQPARPFRSVAKRDDSEKLIQMAPSSLATSLAGHLYFATTTDALDWESIRSFVASEVQEHPRVVEALLELCDFPKNRRGDQVVIFEADPQFADFMKKITSNAGAFVCDDRSTKISRLQLLYKKNKLIETINSLKSQLSLGRIGKHGKTTLPDTIQVVADLNRELQEVLTQLEV